MSSPTPSTAPITSRPPVRRWRRRWVLIPCALVLAVVLALLLLYVRGTWADSEVRNPTTVADGPVSQLYVADGHTQVRCALLLPQPVEEVWAVLTDYGKYHEMLPYLANIEAEKKSAEEYRMKGLAKSAFQGYWPFEITIHQEKKADGGRIWWDEVGGGEVLVNRGSWQVSKHGEQETLLVLSLETEVQSTPTFVLRNFFRYRLKHVERAVEQAVLRRRQGS